MSTCCVFKQRLPLGVGGLGLFDVELLSKQQRQVGVLFQSRHSVEEVSRTQPGRRGAQGSSQMLFVHGTQTRDLPRPTKRLALTVEFLKRGADKRGTGLWSWLAM